MRSKESTGRRVGGRTSQRVSVCIQAKRGRFYLASGVVSDSAHCSERRGPPRRASEREREKKTSVYYSLRGPGPARRGPATPVACAGLRRVGARPRCAMNINDRAPTTTTAVDNSARPPPPPPPPAPGVLLRQCRMISKFRADGCVVLPATERSLAVLLSVDTKYTTRRRRRRPK